MDVNLSEQNFQENTPTDTALAKAKISAMIEPIATLELAQVEQLSPTALAYIGDAVYELYIRISLLMPPKRMANYHSQVVAQVRAESQAICLQTIEPYLTEQEKDILRRGRNACMGKPRRLSLRVYQQATSLETLIGYLHLTNPQRLNELFAKSNSVSSKK